MPAPSIDFRRIRSHRGSQHTGFEELTRQLILAAPPIDTARIDHRGPGADGGVEVLVWLADGTCSGWQSKYFVDAFGAAQVSRLKDSFASALSSYPQLTRYVVVLPRNLSGSGSKPKTDERTRWETFRSWAASEAVAVERNILIDLWDESELIKQLSPPNGIQAGIVRYWFDQTVFSTAWFRDRFDSVRADLADRYSAGDHVDVEVQRHLETLGRTEVFEGWVNSYEYRVEEAVDRARRVSTDRRVDNAIRTLSAEITLKLEVIQQEIRACLWTEAARIDLTESEKRAMDLYGSARDILRWRGDENTEYELRRLDVALEEIIGGPHPANAELLRRPVLLLVGEAGSGKSHALAHAVDMHLRHNAPALVLLGQYFARGDPWPQFAAKLGLTGMPQEEALGALQAAALAAGRPCMVAIDAINEAEDASVWRNHIGGLVRQIERFDRLACVLSCRTTFEGYCLPPSHGITRVVHRGFQGNAAEAAKAYLDKRGIDRPATPFISPEFTNPLFLSTACKALEAQGKNSFPLGLDGLSDMFRFYVDSVQRALISRGFDRFDPMRPVVWNALKGFAEELVLKGVDSLSRDDARALLENSLYPPPAAEHRNTFLFRLEDEGLLRRQPAAQGSGEQVGFTFQRFADHLGAAALLALAETPGELAAALKPGGAFAHLTEADTLWHSAGVLEALMVQVPEKFALELVRIERGFSRQVKLPVSSFVESLKLRTPRATSQQTVGIFGHLLQSEQINSRTFFTTLLEVSSFPSHTLNGEYLHNHLSSLSLADRDASWSAFLIEGLVREGPVAILVDWAASVDAARAEPQRIRLVAVALAWFLSATDRVVRDRATKALATLLYRSPALIAPMVRQFVNVNDPYVRERVLAAYGASLHLHNHPTILCEAAEAAYEMVFAGKLVERHAATREYARGLIEVAAARSIQLRSIDLTLCRPPYRTQPIQH